VAARKPNRKTSFVPRIVFRAVKFGPAVIPVCAAAGVASLEMACVAEQAFYCNNIEEAEGGTFAINQSPNGCPPDASLDAQTRKDAAHDARSDANDGGELDATDGSLLDAPLDALDGRPDSPFDAADGGITDGPFDAADGHGG
jgi:hypothetical protein